MRSKLQDFLHNTIWWIRLLFKKDKKSYLLFSHNLGIKPNNIKYYHIALVHKSMSIIDKKGHKINNERLEFLGDAVLNLVVGHILFKHFPYAKEGELTSTRSKIVKRGTLNQIGSGIGIDKMLKHNLPEQQATIQKNLPGNSLEALIGALYLDKGYRACYRYVRDYILKGETNLDAISKTESNYKSKLNEWCQKKKRDICFTIISQTFDSQKLPYFEVEVSIDGISCGKGNGHSRKEAEQDAAMMAWKQLKTIQSKLPSGDLPQSDHPDQTHTSVSQPHP